MRTRSLLYVPADNPKFIGAAHSTGADVIILDLEDSVEIGKKVAARQGLQNSVRRAGQSGASVFVRINNEPDVLIDDALMAFNAGARAIYVPKASADTLSLLDQELSKVEMSSAREPMSMIALIEDIKSVLDIENIAKINRVAGLTVGGEDLANSMAAQPDPDVLKLPKQIVHWAAKANGLLSFGMFRSVADFRDLDAIKTGAEEAKRFGFDGSSCVHPSAVPALNAAFQPSEAEVLWAKEVVNAIENGGGGVFSLNGKMIDLPLQKRARTILNGLDRAD